MDYSRDNKLRQMVAKNPFLPYGLAVLVTLIAVLFRWLLHPLLGPSLVLVTLYGAIAFTSWVGGWRPTIVSAMLGYVLCNYLFLKPEATFSFDLPQLAGFLAYSFTCLIIITLGEITRNSEKKVFQKEQELRMSENKIRNILESITDSFFNLDKDWRFVYVNPSAEKDMGFPASELLEKTIWDIYPDIIGSELGNMYRKVVADQVSLGTTFFYTLHSKWYEIRAYPAANGLSVYFRDVTRRIEAEQLLQNQSIKLEEIDRRKDEFLATLAHELRNPLAPIRNSLSIMELSGNDAVSIKKSTSSH